MCCGRCRVALAASPESRLPKHASGALARGLRVGVIFVYEGSTALTVTGPISGLIYRFDGRGARLIIDPRDCNAMRSVPHLARSK
jgi:hypothetical protein